MWGGVEQEVADSKKNEIGRFLVPAGVFNKERGLRLDFCKSVFMARCDFLIKSREEKKEREGGVLVLQE